MKAKKVIVDMCCNIVSSAIPVFVLQLILLPALSRNMSSDEYGLVILHLSLFNIVPSAFGNSLNNIRLIEDYHGKSRTNYNRLLGMFCLINSVCILGYSIFYIKSDMGGVLLLNVILSVVWLTKEYIVVGFRIKINYMKILLGNVILSIGYFIGYFVYKMIGEWRYIYLSGLILCLIYISINTKWYKESLKTDSCYKYLFGQTVLLILSSMLYRIPTYADKMMLYPILGGESVAILYVATLTGKIITMVISPVSSVILTYVSKQQKKDTGIFNKALGVSFVLAMIGYVVCVLISKPVLKILYPLLCNDAMELIPLTTATVMITAIISIIDPFILKFYSMKWQIYINGISVVIYFALALFLVRFGLVGFCLGNLLATIIKLFFEIGIFYVAKNKVEVITREN